MDQRYASGEAQGVVRSVADGKLTGYTRHGLNQAIGRDGGIGVAPRAILDAVKSPVEVIQQSGGRTIYVGQNANVVLNQNGQVMTTWATNSAGVRGAP
jgi:hypothetical protein